MPAHMLKTCFAHLVVALVCVGCGGGGSPPPPPPPTSVTQTINAAAGGTINGPGGVTLTIPPAALSTDTAITIALDDTGAPPVPDVLAPLDGPMIALLPHGTSFSAPVTLSMPAAATPELRIFKTNEQRDGWQALVAVQSAGRVETAITSFSNIVRIPCPAPLNPACNCPRPSPLPRIIGEPRDSFTLGEGGFWIFRVDAVACAPTTYRWLRNGFFLPNETNQDILLNPLRFADNGARYSVLVTDAAGRSVTSRAALLTVNATAPVIVNHPTDLQVIAGANAFFTAASTSTIAQTLQWKQCAAAATCPASVSAWPDAAGQTSTQFTLPGVALTNSGDRVAMCASNAAGTTCSNTATLSVITAPVQPVILDQPDAVATVAGRSASFAVLAAGGGLQYQWQRSDSNGPFATIAGASSATYTISNVAVADNGARLRVIVSNTVGTILSNEAALTVQSTVGVALTRVGGGADFSIGLKGNGRLFAWGANDVGQLGNGTANEQAVPVQVNTIDDAATFAVGGRHSLVLRSDGSVWAWGYGATGSLGSGDGNDRVTPFAVPGVPVSRNVAAGAGHSLAVAANGGLWGWGVNGCGQLGDGTIFSTSSAISTGLFSAAVGVAAGTQHSVALRADGSVHAWGCNFWGQLGDGTTQARLVPTRIGSITQVVSVAAGSIHTLALTADGSVYAWGGNFSGQIGDGSMVQQRLAPLRVNLPGIAVAVAAGEMHSLALLADGSVYAWGANGNGQIGNGANLIARVPERVAAPLPAGIVAIGAGAQQSIALEASGAVWAWGLNNARQLGDGTRLNRDRPVLAIGLNLN